jgi:hypothetical protein
MVLQRGMVLERDGFGSILTTFTFFSDGWSVRRHSEAKMMKAVLLAAAAASASAFAPAAVLPRAAKSECPATLYIIAQSLEWRLSEEGGRESARAWRAHARETASRSQRIGYGGMY